MEENKTPRQTFEELPIEKKFELVWPRTQVLISMVKDVEFNMRKFLIPQGKMKKESIFVTEFYQRYYQLFPKERPDAKTDNRKN